ncbi:Major facilitator superfamily domain general substrate transporter [Penicillium canariense]|uniref:Major facilitator superfamily domain general substrate transporter n=1 Tax=Penicillium canariense TaxID=189055 RepID=A0A9W9IFD6_9EURO|nr:Major facilitator superfamily domain general substrate transporter [Penicillium canariense]KAJ5176618.1 Major facilitator superfamily domain general substrate transporter [Penicillium canariense]
MQTVADLMLVNILSCIVGALAEIPVQMTVADVFFVHESHDSRSYAGTTGWWIHYPFQGWCWVWWWMAILFGAGLVAFIFLYEETMFCVPSIEVVPVTDKLTP